MVHGPFETAHSNRFIPEDKPVTELDGNVGLENVPVPETTDQNPVPIRGEVAWSEAALAQV